jgi:hypothetical protein
MVSLLLVSSKREKNNKLFAHKILFVVALVENVTIVSWWWLETHKHDFDYDFNQ